MKGLFPQLDIRLAAICATALVPVLLYTGSYDFFERIVVAMCVVLIAGVVYTLFHVPLPAGPIGRGLIPSIPEGSLATIMGLMGWVGAGTTTLLYSSWVNEKIGKAENETEYRAWISTMRLDCFASYTLILAISFAFLAMGVATLHAKGLVPAKHEMMSQLSCMLDSFRGGRETFLVVAFFAMFSTIVSCMDGKSRAIASIVADISPRFGNKLRIYRTAMAAYLVIMVVTILLGDNQPGAVINLVAAMNAVVFGLLGFVLLYLDRKLPTYARCHPAAWCVLFAGSLVFLGVSVMKAFT